MNEEQFIERLKESARAMEADGISPDQIQSFIDQKKDEWRSINPTEPEDLGKTNATAEETANVVAEPVGTELQSENGLSESPRKSVRKQTREKDIQRNENIFNEKVSVAEKGFYEATNVDEAELYEQTLQELEKEFAVAGKPVTKGTYMGSTYTYTPADDYVGDKKAMYDIYTSSGGVSLSEDYLAETLFNKKKTLATAYIDDLPTDVKEKVEKNVEQDFSAIQEKIQNTEKTVQKAINIRSRIDEGEQVSPEEIKEYIAIAKSIPELQEQYNNASSASKDNAFALEYFKKSYKVADQIGAALKTTGLQAVSGALELGNMMAYEKDYQSGTSKYVNDVLLAHQKDIAENLEAPISIDDLRASGDVWSGADTWATQLFANQVPYLLAASTGTAAPYLFGAIGTTSRLSEFSTEEQTARENVKKLETDLLNATDDFDIAVIKSDLEKNKEITSKNDGLKLLTSVGHGAFEMIDGYADKLLLGGVKKAWKRIPSDDFKASWKQAGKQYGTGVLTETGAESLTQVGQNAFDIWFDNADKSYFEGLEEAAVGGFVMGNGFKVAEFGGIASNIVANVAADKEAKAETNRLLEKLNGFRDIVKDPNSSEAAKQEAIKQRRKTEKELIRLSDVTLARFEALGFEQQQEVMELDKKARSVNRRWTKIAVDPSLSDKEKDAIKAELEIEFNEHQDQKRSILQTTAPANLVSADKVKDGLFEDGDLLRDFDDGNVSLQRIKAHNKKTGYVKAAVQVSDQALEDITNFVEEGDTDATIEVDGTKINFEQAQAITTQNKGRNGFYDPVSSIIVYMPQRGKAKGKSLAAVPLHEYLHATFKGLGISKSEFADIKEDLVGTIDDLDLPESKKDAIKESIALYDERIGARVKNKEITPEQAKEIGGEEIFNIIGDVIAQDVLRGNKKQNFLQKLSIRIRNLLNGKLDAEVIDGLNIDTAQGALEFVTRFQENVTAGKTITKQTLSGTTTDDDAKAVGSEIAEEVKFEDDSINEQFKAFTYDGKVNNAPDSFRVTAAYQYEPLAQSVVKTLANKGIISGSPEQNNLIMGYLEDGTNRQELVEQLVIPVGGDQASSLLGLAKTYNPEIGSFGGYAKGFLAARAIRQLEKKMKGSFIGSQKIDSPEAKQIASNDIETGDIDTRKTSEKLGFDNTIKNEAASVAAAATQSASNELSGKNLSDKKKANLKKKAFDKLVENRIMPLVKKAIGKNTKTNKAFTDFVSKNFEPLRDIFLDQIDVQKGSGPASLWNVDNPPSLEEFLDYYEGSGTTKSDRRSSLARAVSRSIANEARVEFAKKDPETAELFKKEHGVVLASEIPLPDNKTLQTLAGIAGFKDGAGMPASNVWKAFKAETNIGFNLSTESGRKRAIKAMEFALTKGNVPLDAFATGGLMINSNPRFFKEQEDAYKDAKKEYAKNPTTENKKNVEETNKARLELRDMFVSDMDRMLDRIKKEGKVTYLTGAAEGWTKNKNSFAKNGKTLEEILNSFKNGTTEKFNKANLAMFEQTMRPLYNLIANNPKDPTMVNLVMMLTNTSNGGSNLWFRLGAEVVGSSSFLLPGKEGKRGIEWEHAMQANNARLFLLNSAINKVPWSTVYPAVKRNYKVIALDKSLDDILKAAKRGNAMGIGWNVYTGHWTERYFHPDVFAVGGIDPSTIVDINGQTLADKYKIDSAGKSTKVLGSEILDADFNKMLERVKGIKAEAVYSEDRANKLAGNKGKFKFFVPYSAEDFVGLIYPTLGKGKEGDRNLQWYKENLLDPFAIGINNFEKAKQAAMNDWAELKKKIKNTPAGLKKEAVRGFTNEEAVRVYLWNENGVVPETLAKKDVTFMVKHVNDNKVLKDFAESVKSILGGKYPDPQGDWLAGTLTTDLINDVNTVGRKEFLQQWQENVDVVYSKDNMNKLKAIYGERYTEALDNILHRMKTGRNRPGNKTRLENSWMDWVNDSVGTVMFFNTRSALLQTISSINFLNWSDNNPIMAGKAFANQPQFWKDFAFLFNSDFLKQRRSGLKNDVNADEIANAAATSTNKVKAALSAVLQAGFLPTQMADSFAISIGGASFYRNRLNTYLKEGGKFEKPQVIFLTGAAGSGKTTVAKNFGKNWAIVNKDVEMEALMKKAGLPSDLNKLTREQGDKWRKIQSKASENALNKIKKLREQGKNIIIDDTGSSEPTLSMLKRELEKSGYESKMLLLGTSLEQSLKRNKDRKQRTLTDVTVKNSFEALMNNKKRYKEIFKDGFIEATGGKISDNLIDELTGKMSQKQAEKKAFEDFRETAEESQQSSRPDRVSMQQAGSLGRVILAFANTPMQYTRLTKKAALDLVNGRGDWKTNMSKILYYGAVQNIAFTALQQAMFAMLFDDDTEDEEKEASAKIVNGIADTFLRGSGVGGAAVATMKNIIMEVIKQKESKRADYTKAALKATTLSPPIDTKIRKLMSAGRAFTYKQSLEDMKTKGISVDNPAALALGQMLSAAANVPADRAILKARNVKGALDSENEAWQQIALALGYSEWQLGIEKDDIESKKTKSSKKKKSKTKKKKLKANRLTSPNRRLEDGVGGVANKNGTIEIAPDLDPVEKEITIVHEQQHIKDMEAGILDYDDNYVYWKGKKYPRKNGKIKYNGKWYIEGSKSLPWEKKAYDAEPSESAVKRKLYE